MSDSYFIGTVARVQDIPRFSSPAALRRALKALKNPSDLEDQDIRKYLKDLSEQEARELRTGVAKAAKQTEIGMMVSLDHTIYFHNRRGFRADEWIFTEMMSPWAGEGRGLVMQRMWAQDGTLIATCVQEVRIPINTPYKISGVYLEQKLTVNADRVSYGLSKISQRTASSDSLARDFISPIYLLCRSDGVAMGSAFY